VRTLSNAPNIRLTDESRFHVQTTIESSGIGAFILSSHMIDCQRRDREICTNVDALPPMYRLQ
jgi:hypothetical protein